MRRYRWTLAGALGIVGVAVLAGMFGRAALDGGGGEPAGAVQLPTACENFIEVTTMFAEQGSTSALSMTGGNVFAEDPETRVFEVLRNLLDACDAELTSRDT